MLTSLKKCREYHGRAYHSEGERRQLLVILYFQITDEVRIFVLLKNLLFVPVAVTDNVTETFYLIRSYVQTNE